MVTGMRISSSLQNLSTYAKIDPAASDIDLEVSRSYTHAKPLHALQREGVASSFSKEKSFSTTQSRWKKWTRAITFLAAILLLSLLIFACTRYFSSSLSHEASEYYVILDCGSTGTRVYVYEWSIDRTNGKRNLPIVLKSLPDGFQRSTARSGRAYQRMETEPGFGKLVHNDTGLRAAIKPLIQWAERQIPKHAHKSSSLFLYATAGVRRLPSSDSEWLLDKAWSILKNSSFLCRREWVKIITGMEEAYYGWIALNYHMGVLGSLPAKHTFGALDLGGSSLQVTFETENPIHGETGINLSIGAVNHHLSAYSLSGYGLNDAFDKSVAHLLKKLTGTTTANLKGGKVELRHPCLHTGYREEYICSHCAALTINESPTDGERTTDKRRRGIAIELVGAPNWKECSALAKTTVNMSEWSDLTSSIDCALKPCALSDSLPQPRGKFYAMSGFFVVFRFFNLTSGTALNDVLQRGQEFCARTWEVAKNSVTPQPFIEQYCFRAPYIVSLLRDGLYIRDNQVVIGSGSITWTLGAALLEAGQAFSSRIEFNGYRIFHKEINPTILLVMLMISAIILFCAVACVCNWMPRFFRRSYLPLFRHNSSSTSVRNIPSPFSLQRWSPINSGEGRTKMPLSPVADSERQPFGMGYGIDASGIQLIESSLYPFGVSHSYSSGSLGQLQFGSGTGSWTPHRGQTLSSRRSQSREDLSSSLVEAHVAKA